MGRRVVLSSALVFLLLAFLAKSGEGADGTGKDTYLLRLPHVDHSAYGQLQGNAVAKSLNQFTLCHCVRSFKKVHNNTSSSAILTYSVGKDLIDISTFTNSHDIWFFVSGNFGTSARLSREPDDGKWMTLCFAWASKTGLMQVYENGKQIQSETGKAVGHRVASNGVAVLGQWQTSPGVISNRTYWSWKGDIRNVQLWDYVLKPEQIAAHSKCPSELEGNILSWTSNINVETFNGATLKKTKMCQPD